MTCGLNRGAPWAETGPGKRPGEPTPQRLERRHRLARPQHRDLAIAAQLIEGDPERRRPDRIADRRQRLDQAGRKKRPIADDIEGDMQPVGGDPPPGGREPRPALSDMLGRRAGRAKREEQAGKGLARHHGDSLHDVHDMF